MSVILLLIKLVDFLKWAFILALLVYSIMTWVMKPWHPARRFLERFIEPLLNPIRRVLPMVGGIDFSPLVLLILVQLLSSVITNLLYALVR
jgi:YggT family protein